MKNIVYMIGAEAVGKSSVGSLLAMLLVGQFVECESRDVLDGIIADAGDDQDNWYVVEVTPELVLADGCMELLKESGIVVFLKASTQELAWRASGCPEPEEDVDDMEDEEEDEISIFDESLLKRLSDEQEKIEQFYQKGSGIKLDTTSLDIMEIVQILHMILTQ